MSQTFVLPSNESTFANSNEFAMFGFRSILPNASVTGANEDPDHPFIFCTDFQDDTQYSPAIDSGTVTIDIAVGTSEQINYMGLAIFNGATAGLSGTLEYLNLQDNLYEEISAFNQPSDASPIILQFTPVQSNRFRLKLNFTSKLFIGCIYIGDGIRFPTTPAIGFQPPSFNRLDEVKSFQTAGNNFTRSRLIVRNNQSKGEISFYRFSELELWWNEYLNHIYQSKAVFFQWSNNTIDPMYGRQNINSPPRITYKNSFYASMPFEFNGYARR